MKLSYLVLATIVSSAIPVANAATQNIADNLCSMQGVANLVPAFRDKDGSFEVPNPTTDLPRFLQAYDGLRNVINVALAQAEANADLTQVGSQPYTRLMFGKNWLSSEVGFVSADGKAPDFSKVSFGSYGDASFLNNIEPVPGTGGTFYTVPGHNVFISPIPTVLPCVNLVMETSGNDSGTFISPSYALGTKEGKVFMLVNGCQNTSTMTTIDGKTVMAPGPTSFLGIQVSAPYFDAPAPAPATQAPPKK